MKFSVIKEKADLTMLKNDCKLYKKEDFRKIKNSLIKELCGNYDYIIEVNNYNDFIKNSKVGDEIEKIKKIKIEFTNFNNSFIRESKKSETDDLEETSDREILNRQLVRNLKNRRIPYTRKDAIYLSNKVDESYQDVKSFYLNVSLSYLYNHDFKEICRRLKKAIPSKNQQYTIFNTIWLSSFYDDKEHRQMKVCVYIPELQFNNESFNKNLYKLFAPYTAILFCDVARLMCKGVGDYEGFPVVCAYDDRVVDMQIL